MESERRTIYTESPHYWLNRPGRLVLDPLSEVLSLVKPRSYVSGAFGVDGEIAIQWPKHDGIKCYAMLNGQCWLTVEGVAEPVLISPGDCFLLPRGLPFCLATSLNLPPTDFLSLRAAWKTDETPTYEHSRWYIAGGHFLLTGSHADMLLQSLPSIVHIRNEADKAAMRWSLERMRDELRDPQPGGSLIAQQLAYVMLVQALRLHLADGAEGRVGWLFALADQQMSRAITCMHDAPGHGWTLQTLAAHAGMSRTVFAQRFKEAVGTTPMEYLARWRMTLAGERLRQPGESIYAIASSLGYESESAFGKAFRRVMGCSPRQHSRNARTA